MISGFPLASLRLTTLLLVVLLAFGSGCDSNDDDAPDPVTFDATIQLFVLGDGPPAFLLDRLDSDGLYYPLNLPAAFQDEGARVRVEGLRINTFEVYGIPPVEIARITRIDG